MSIIFLSTEGLILDGKLVNPEARLDLVPWYKILWWSLFKRYYTYVVLYVPKKEGG